MSSARTFLFGCVGLAVLVMVLAIVFPAVGEIVGMALSFIVRALHVVIQLAVSMFVAVHLFAGELVKLIPSAEVSEAAMSLREFSVRYEITFLNMTPEQLAHAMQWALTLFLYGTLGTIGYRLYP